jgi:filamentous hemagglutinin
VKQADEALQRAKEKLSRARINADKAAERADKARENLGKSQKYLERLRINPDAGPRRLPVVQAPRTITGPNGRTLNDRGYEGRRNTDPPLGMFSRRFARNDANYQRMLDGRPPIGEDGEPIQLHHRTRGPMSRLDEYTGTQHRELGLHEQGLDSQIDRAEFDEQRARYWVWRARTLLDSR